MRDPLKVSLLTFVEFNVLEAWCQHISPGGVGATDKRSEHDCPHLLVIHILLKRDSGNPLMVYVDTVVRFHRVSIRQKFCMEPTVNSRYIGSLRGMSLIPEYLV